MIALAILDPGTFFVITIHRVASLTRIDEDIFRMIHSIHWCHCYGEDVVNANEMTGLGASTIIKIHERR